MSEHLANLQNRVFNILSIARQRTIGNTSLGANTISNRTANNHTPSNLLASWNPTGTADIISGLGSGAEADEDCGSLTVGGEDGGPAGAVGTTRSTTHSTAGGSNSGRRIRSLLSREEREKIFREERRREKIRQTKVCCKKFFAFLFSHIGLSGLVVAYTVLGGFLFRYLEKAEELRIKHEVSQHRDDTIKKLLDELQKARLQQRHAIKAVLTNYTKMVVYYIQESGWNGEDSANDLNWSLEGAILFAVTVITTIGYGHAAPKTQLGKFVTMLYAFFGIPLMFLYLSNIGDYLADVFRVTYSHACRRAWRSMMKRSKNRRLRSRKENGTINSTRRNPVTNSGDIYTLKSSFGMSQRSNRNIFERHPLPPRPPPPPPLTPKSTVAVTKRKPNFINKLLGFSSSVEADLDKEGNPVPSTLLPTSESTQNVAQLSGPEEINFAMVHRRFHCYATFLPAPERQKRRVQRTKYRSAQRRGVPMINWRDIDPELEIGSLENLHNMSDGSNNKKAEHLEVTNQIGVTIEEYLPGNSLEDLNIETIMEPLVDEPTEDQRPLSYPLVNKQIFCCTHDKDAPCEIYENRGVMLSSQHNINIGLCVSENPLQRAVKALSTKPAFIPTNTSKLPETTANIRHNSEPPRKRKRSSHESIHSDKFSESNSINENKDSVAFVTNQYALSMTSGTESISTFSSEALNRLDCPRRVSYLSQGHGSDSDGSSSSMSHGERQKQAALKKKSLKKTTVPISLSLTIMTAYIVMGAVVFTIWEDDDYLKWSYFCFITLSTIGFGDIVPGTKIDSDNPQSKMIILSLYVAIGLSVFAMCFKLMQEEVIAKMKRLGRRLGIIKRKFT